LILRGEPIGPRGADWLNHQQRIASNGFCRLWFDSMNLIQGTYVSCDARIASHHWRVTHLASARSTTELSKIKTKTHQNKATQTPWRSASSVRRRQFASCHPGHWKYREAIGSLSRARADFFGPAHFHRHLMRLLPEGFKFFSTMAAALLSGTLAIASLTW